MGSAILIVDDEPALRKIFDVILKSKNYRVVTAANGKAAIEAVQKEPVGLVLLDFFLPDLNGQEVYEAMRKLPEFGNTPVIFISASGQKIKELPDLENTEKHVKPITREQLLSLAEKYMKKE